MAPKIPRQTPGWNVMAFNVVWPYASGKTQERCGAEAEKARSPLDTSFIGEEAVDGVHDCGYDALKPRPEQSEGQGSGQSISHAVDVVEVVQRWFFRGKLNIKEVKIASEVLGEEGDTRNVSTREIVLEKAAK